MKQPPGYRWVVGQAPVTLAVAGMGCWFIYVWTQNSEAWPLALIGLAAMAWAAEANAQVARYKAWKRAWDSMAPDATLPAKLMVAQRVFLMAAIVLATGWYLAAHQDQPGYAAALAWLVVGIGLLPVLWLGRMLARRARRRSTERRRKAAPVAICARPVMAVPTLDAAYQALPEHCHRLLRGQG